MRFILLLLTFPVLTGYVISQPVFHFPVTLPAELKAYAGNDTTIQSGQTVMLGSIPSAVGGYGNYQYNWLPAASLDDPSLPNPVASPANTTVYTLEVTDGENCTTMASVTVTVDTLSLLQSPAFTAPVLIYAGDDLYLDTYFDASFNLIITGISARQISAARVEEGTGRLRLIVDGEPGMYIITIQGSDFVYQTKCIKL